jgi:hypothetical protein
MGQDTENLASFGQLFPSCLLLLETWDFLQIEIELCVNCNYIDMSDIFESKKEKEKLESIFQEKVMENKPLLSSQRSLLIQICQKRARYLYNSPFFRISK